MVQESPSASPRPAAAEAASATAFALLDGLWHGPVGLAVLDRALRFVQVNEPFAEVNGVPAAAHVGRTFPEVAAAHALPAREEMERLEDACRVVIETGRPFLNLVARGALPDGREREWLCSVFPVSAADGSVRGALAMVSDATDDREREAALVRARDDAEGALRRLERLLEVTAALSQARTEADVTSVLVLQADRVFGVSAAVAYVVRRGALELVASMGEASGRGPPLDRIPLDLPVPVAVAARSGEPIWVETPEEIARRFPRLAEVAPYSAEFAALAALPLRVGDSILGVVAFGFARAGPIAPEERSLLRAGAEQCAIALDRARLLDAERDARTAEARSRALLDALVENAPIGIAFLDRDLRFRRLNQLLADMHGLPVEAHLGRTLRELLPGLPPDRIEQALRDVVETGRPMLGVEIDGETPAAPGKRRSWLEAWYPVREGAEVLGVGALVQEVTAERDADEFRRNVLGIVGHDLRSPLAALVTCADLLVRHGGLAPEPRRIVDRMLSLTGRMDRIISVLLDYASLRAGRGLPLRRARCDLSALASAVADECEASHPGRRVLRAGTGDPVGSWDPDRIAQALANVLSNALEYGSPDTPVDLTWREEGDEVVLAVANDGPPIPEDVLPLVFEPFRRAGPQRARGGGGLGLGLFIARAIAVAHGGSIDVRSAAGERTVFTFRLPRRADAP